MGSSRSKISFSELLPIAEWLPGYKKSDLAGDMLAGLIVAIMLVPQSMAYAMLAGLPPQVGLYASIVPLVAYAAFGSSKVLAVGPVAMVSLLTLSSVGAYARGGTAEFIALALLLALIAGIIQLAMGAARLGFFVNFLSHPVLVGFTSAAAIVIGVSQLKHIFGISVSRTEQPYQAIGEIISALPGTNSVTLTIGILSIGLLIYFRSFLAKQLLRLRVPENIAASIGKAGALVVVLLGTAFVWLLGLDMANSVKIVGAIPTGLPPLTIPDLNIEDVTALLPAAMIISLVGFTESISIATTLASRRRQKIDANQELIALGASNIAASFTGGYPVTGGLSRSAVNAGSGANTPLSSIITAVLIVVTVLFLTPLFYFLPQAVLGAIVVVAVAGLFDLKSFVHIWRYSKTDAIALLATFFGVLLFNIEVGIGIGVGTALVLYLYRTSRPHIAVVGRVGKTEHFRNINRHKVDVCPETHAVRIDESLYFANARSLENTLLNAVAENKELKNIVLICSAVNQIDSSALETLERVIDELRSAGVRLFLAEVKGPVMDRLKSIGFVDRFGEENIFLSTHLAFEHLGCANGV
ncbi:MAG: solute carrier family 26 protein [Acidobacteriota bacterium]|nr:solute carrier family 26 protein [Acidobacteriota bacterium]MDH3530068.1 solute carrier family 26 protein [Acidobacteriota bacterium]